MKEIQDESVHLIVTSPPYWQLKEYGDGKQIGFNDTYEEHIHNLSLVWMNAIEFCIKVAGYALILATSLLVLFIMEDIRLSN